MDDNNNNDNNNSLETHVVTIVHYLKSKYYRHAQLYADAVMEKHGSDSIISFWRAVSMVMLMEKGGGLQEAIRALKALENKRDCVLSCRMASLKAYQLMGQSNSSAAIQDQTQGLESMMSRSDLSAVAWFQAALFSFVFDSEDETVSILSKGLEAHLQSKDSTVTSMKALLLSLQLRTESYSRISDQFVKLLEMESNNPWVCYNHVSLLHDVGATEEALKLVTKYTKKKPPLIALLIMRLKLLASCGQWDSILEASSDLNTAHVEFLGDSKLLSEAQPNSLKYHLDSILALCMYNLCKQSNISAAEQQVQIIMTMLQDMESNNAELRIHIVRNLAKMWTKESKNFYSCLKQILDQVTLNGTESYAAEYLIAKAETFKNQPNYLQKAEEVYLSVLKKDPRNTEALEGKLLCSLFKGDSLIAFEQDIKVLYEGRKSSGLTGIAHFLQFMATKDLKYLKASLKDMSIEHCKMKVEFSSYKQLNPSLVCFILNTCLKYYRISFSEYYVPEELIVLMKDIAKGLDRFVPGWNDLLLISAKIKILNSDYAGAKSLVHQCIKADSSDVEAFLLQAELLLKAKQPKAAIQVLDSCLSLNFAARNNIKYYFVRALAYKDCGRYDESLECINTAVLMVSSTPQDDNQTEKIIGAEKRDDMFHILLEKVDLLLLKNDAKAAEAALEVAGKTQRTSNSGEPLLIMKQADIELHSLGGKNWRRAIELLETVKYDGPSTFLVFKQAMVKKSKILLKNGNDTKAFLDIYNELFEKFPEHPDVSIMYGDALLSVQQVTEATSVFEQVMHKFPDKESELTSKIGRALTKSLKFNKALTFYEKFLSKPEQKNKRSIMLYDYVSLQKKLGHNEAVIELIKVEMKNENSQMLEEAIFRILALILLSEIYCHNGDIDTALVVLKKAVSQANFLSQYFGPEADIAGGPCNRLLSNISVRMSDLYHKQGKVEHACKSCNEAISYDNQNYAAQLSLSRLHLEKNDLPSAQNCCAAVLKTDPMSEDAVLIHTKILFKQKNFNGAVSHLKPFLDKNPTCFDALWIYIELYNSLGKLTSIQPNKDIENLFIKIERLSGAYLSKEYDAQKMKSSNENVPSSNQSTSGDSSTRESYVMPRDTGKAAIHRGYQFCKGIYLKHRRDASEALKCFHYCLNDTNYGELALKHMIDIYLEATNPAAPISEDTASNSSLQPNSGLSIAQKLLSDNLKGESHSLLKQSLYHRVLVASRQKNEIEKTISEMQALVEKQPNFAPGVLALGSAFLALKQNQRAKNVFQSLVKTEWPFEFAQDYEKCFLYLADIQIQYSKFDAAMECFKLCIGYNQACSKAYEGLGFLMEREASYANAAGLYEQAWKHLRENDPALGFKLAYCYLRSKKYVEAIVVCHKILKDFPSYPRLKKEILDKARKEMDGESKRKQIRSKSISPSRKTPSKRLTRRSLREAYSDNDADHVELPTKNPNVLVQPADEELMDQVPSPPEAPSPHVEDLVTHAETEEDGEGLEQFDNLDYTESTAVPIITEPENGAEDYALGDEAEGSEEADEAEEIIIEKAETLSEIAEEDVQMVDADFSEEDEDIAEEAMEPKSQSAAPTRGPLADLVRSISSSVFGTPLPTTNANAKPKAVETPAPNADFYALKSEKMLLDLQMEQRTEEHEKRVADLNRKIIELTEQLEEAKMGAQKARDASAVVANAEVAKIQEELQQVNKENFELKNSLKKEEDEVKMLLTKLLSKEEALVNFDSDMEELRKENSKIKNLYKELQMERFNEQQGSVEARFSLNSVSKQNELMKEHLKFMECELKTKSEELIVARRNHNDEIVQIRTELNQKSSELNSALNYVELLKKEKQSVEKLLDNSKQQLIKQKTDAVKREDFLTEEISTLRKMNESLKKKNKEKEESVSRLTKEMETVDSVVNQKVHQMELEMNKISSENQMLKEENSRLKAESVPLIRDFSQVHLDSPGGDRSNFVTVYSNCVKFSNELKALRTEYNHLLQVNNELLVEVNTTRARNEDLTSDKKLVLREYESVLSNYDVVKREYEIVNQDLESLRKDFVVIQRDNDTLRFQLANLIRQMSGETPEGVGSYMEDPVYGRQSDTLNVINDNLVKFDDVKDLVQKNGELLKITREFGLKLEEHESCSQLNEKKIKDYEAKISDFIGKLTNIKEEYEKKIKDMEIRLYDSGSTTGNSDLRKEYEQYKENALSQMRDLQKDVSSLNAQLLESKMAAVKFETESQMLKERNGFLTESVKNAEKELEIARRDRSQLAKTNEDLEKQVKQSLLRLEDLNNQRRSIENDLTLTKGRLSLLEQDIVRVREEKSELSREKNQLMVLLNTRLQEPAPSSPQRPSNANQAAVAQRNSHAEDNSVSALEYKSLFSKYEQLMKDYQALNKQYQEEKEKVSKELNKVIKEKEELLEKIRSRPAMTALNSSESNTMEIISLKDQVSSLTNIAKELEEKLNQSEDTMKVLEEEKKQEAEKVKDANEVSKQHATRIKELNVSLDDLKKKNETLETMIDTLKDNLATCMDDLKRQSLLAQEANNNYESEIIKHGKNLELLKEAKDANFKLKQENSNLQQQLETVKKSIQTEMSSLLEQKDALKKKSDEFDERMKAVKQENDLIKRELLNSGNAGVANNSVLNALRNDLNLLELENQSLTIKNSRLESDLFNVRLELQEIQNNMSSSGLDRAAADTDDVQFRLNQLDLLRESNETLRSENRRLESSLEENKKSSQKLKEEKLKIQEMANKLNNDMKFANERISLLEEDNQKWQKRNEQILMKYNQIDPEELVKLENNNQQLSSQLSAKQREIDRLTSTIQSYMKEHESLSKNMTELLKEHEVLTAKIKDLTQNNTQLAKEVSELRIAASNAESNQVAELEEKLQAAEEKLIEAEEKYLRYFHSGKGWKVKYDETAKETADLKSKLENLQGEFEKSIKSTKDEHIQEISSLNKRAETKEKLKQSMSDKTIKKLELEKAELQAKLEQFSKGASVSSKKAVDNAPIEVGGSNAKRVREDDSFDVSGSIEKLIKLDTVEASPKEQATEQSIKDKPSVAKKFMEKNKDEIPLIFSDSDEPANSRQAVESVGNSNESLEHSAVSESNDGKKVDSEMDLSNMEEDTIDQFLDSIQGETSSTPSKKKVATEEASEPTKDMIIPEQTLLVEEKLVEPEESVHSEYVPSQGEEDDSDESGELTDAEEETKPGGESKPESPLPDKATGVPQAPPQPPSNVIVTQTGTVIKKITFDEPAKPAVKSTEKATKLRASTGGIGRGRSAAALLQQSLPATKGATRGTKRTRGKK